MNFLKNILSTLIALLLFSVAGFFIMLGVIGSLSEKDKVVVKENSILFLNLDKPITEQEIENPLDDIEFLAAEESSIGLIQLKMSIKNAAQDSNIKGIYLRLHYFMGGMSTLEEVRMELEDFKESGKFIIAYTDYYSEGAYYLASVADQVLLNPEGEIELNGLNANVTFFTGLFEKLGIEPEIFRVGEFKSAVEPYFRKSLSPENELQLSELLNGINNNMLNGISKSREIDFDRLKEISNKMEVREAEDALRLNLIDQLAYEDEVLEKLKEASGVSDLEMISYKDYKKSFSTFKLSSNEVAVIVASGEIVMGRGEDGNIGGDKFAKQIREAREDSGIKAIVLRINSPGGSYLASDVMWREIKLASETKPVIASMSDYAASGGYYMAMACDTIIAQPNTITGSIGIFGMMFNLQGLLEDKLGLNHDEVQTGEFSGMMTVTRPLTDVEKSIIQKSVEKNYYTFIDKAAEGRGMSREDMLKIASGRVWTGTQAEKLGLVDILGDFDDAIEMAAEKAGISDDYKVKYYPEIKPFFERIFEDFEDQARVKMIKSEVGEFYPYLEKIKKVKNLRGTQARMPFELEIN
ncbi:signal peptide peptidase SppA [Fulvivirga sp.]|uniref:signal peptide peptidase SppA n=1 Tax=Fulvivirga sp. TaxID=1931237 RepID=UPI0032EAB806